LHDQVAELHQQTGSLAGHIDAKVEGMTQHQTAMETKMNDMAQHQAAMDAKLQEATQVIRTIHKMLANHTGSPTLAYAGAQMP
jgi:hypothetical protein